MLRNTCRSAKEELSERHIEGRHIVEGPAENGPKRVADGALAGLPTHNEDTRRPD
jgi:hypothetical protein